MDAPLGRILAIPLTDARLARARVVVPEATLAAENPAVGRSRVYVQKLDCTHPTILYGYGGYGISMTPQFSSMRRLWLDYGGVYALAGIRGGGEYGEAWHVAGMLTRKQNVFDDFAASMQLLVDRKFTS